jgi:fatty acid/phospholipid synthesis protein plsX
MKFVVDAFGADKGEEVVVRGCVDALNLKSDLELILVGNTDIVEPLLAACSYDKSRLEVIDAKDTITNNESPTVAIKTKKQSSMVVSCDICRERDDVDGIISAGSTGALLTGAIFKIGRLPGVLRPALSPLVPIGNGRYLAICDSGANMDCRPEYLAQFAIMASSLMKAVAGIENPKVALVSVGEEDKKGNELTHAAFPLVKATGVNFVGNMEARYALTGDYDVIVCDGFVGNVLLKTIEGTALYVMRSLKHEIMQSKKAKIGAFFMKGAFSKLKNQMDYQKVGGACFLGIKKIVVKAHGSSSAEAVCASIITACKLKEKKYIEETASNIMAYKKSQQAAAQSEAVAE